MLSYSVLMNLQNERKVRNCLVIISCYRFDVTLENSPHFFPFPVKYEKNKSKQRALNMKDVRMQRRSKLRMT